MDAREDSDRLLSYYTKQQVMFLDRKLGATFYFVQLLIAAYIVGYMFIYKKGYLELEQAKGAVTTHVYGDAASVSSGKKGTRYFSSEDITYPGLENGNVFIATRQKVHFETRGMCEDHAVPCLQASDCTSGAGANGAEFGECGVNGFCIERSWCDKEDHTGTKDPEVYELDTGSLQIWARSTIQYVKIAPERVFSTETKEPMPKRGYNTFTVRELLMMCEPLPVRYEEVAELGAAIEVQFFWECNVKADDCHPQIRARRLDTIFDPDNIGFGFSYPEYIDEEHRYRNEVKGVRIFFRTAGIGKKVSVSATITKASMGAALFAIAQIIADLLMTKLFKDKKKYNARKYENTPDFSEWMAEKMKKQGEQVSLASIEEEEKRVLQKEEDWMRKLDEEDV